MLKTCKFSQHLFLFEGISKTLLIEPRPRSNEGLLRVCYGCMKPRKKSAHICSGEAHDDGYATF